MPVDLSPPLNRDDSSDLVIETVKVGSDAIPDSEENCDSMLSCYSRESYSSGSTTGTSSSMREDVATAPEIQSTNTDLGNSESTTSIQLADGKHAKMIDFYSVQNSNKGSEYLDDNSKDLAINNGQSPRSGSLQAGEQGSDLAESSGDVESTELAKVFAAMDEHGTGQVKIARLVELAGVHLSGEQTVNVGDVITRLGDPDATIGYEDFCLFIRTITGEMPPSGELTSTHQVPTDHNTTPTQDLTSSNHPPVPSPFPSPPYPPIETHHLPPDRSKLRQRKVALNSVRDRRKYFGTTRTRSLPAHTFFSPVPDGEETMRGEGTGSPSSLSEVDSAIGGSTTSPTSSRKNNSGTWSISEKEVNYESLGEVEDMEESTPYSGGGNLNSTTNSQHSSLPPSTLGQRNNWARRSLRCSPSGNGPRRFSAGGTAAGAATHLFRSPSFSLGRSPGGHPDGDDIPSDASMEEDVQDLMSQVKILQGKVEELGDSHNDSQDRIVRVKQDNSVLQARVNMLEEQLRESEHRGEERLAEEMRRNKEMITRIEREKELTIENYSIKQISLDKTNEMLQEEIQRLKIKMEKQLKESNERENRISEGELMIRTIKEEKKNIQQDAKRELAEKMQMADREILELRSKVEHLTSELQSHSRRRLPSTDADATNAAHMSEALKNLKEENGGLREQVEDLQAELLTRSVVEGERVTAAHSNSLKAEFEQMSVEELQKSLQSAQDDNKHLRSYIDGILLNIIEKYPQLLEVKQKA